MTTVTTPRRKAKRTAAKQPGGPGKRVDTFIARRRRFERLLDREEYLRADMCSLLLEHGVPLEKVKELDEDTGLFWHFQRLWNSR